MPRESPDTFMVSPHYPSSYLFSLKVRPGAWGQRALSTTTGNMLVPGSHGVPIKRNSADGGSSIVCRQSLEYPDLGFRADEFTYWLHACAYGACGLMPLLSTLAHLLHCKSETWYRAWWDADHVGILALWLARALCESYGLLYCHRQLWLFWSILSTAVFAASTMQVAREGVVQLSFCCKGVLFPHACWKLIRWSGQDPRPSSCRSTSGSTSRSPSPR